MKLDLQKIETAVRKQFIWDRTDPKTKWATEQAYNLGSKGLGASVFIGLAYNLGFSLVQIEAHMDLEPLDIKAKLNAFNTRMQEMVQRKLTGNDLEKKDMTQLMHVKSSMSMSYIRMHYLAEHITIPDIIKH